MPKIRILKSTICGRKFVKAGDVVQEGELMALLDDRDLRLESEKWASQQHQYARQAQEAQAQAAYGAQNLPVPRGNICHQAHDTTFCRTQRRIESTSTDSITFWPGLRGAAPHF